MGFINNTSYILNAVLTKKGKQYLASGEATKGNASQMIDKLKDALS